MHTKFDTGFFFITITTSSDELLVPAGIIHTLVPVPSQESETSWMCFRGIDIISSYNYFWNCSDIVVFFIFHFTAVFFNSFNVFYYWKFEANRNIEFIVAFNTLGILFQLRW